MSNDTEQLDTRGSDFYAHRFRIYHQKWVATMYDRSSIARSLGTISLAAGMLACILAVTPSARSRCNELDSPTDPTIGELASANEGAISTLAGFAFSVTVLDENGEKKRSAEIRFGLQAVRRTETHLHPTSHKPMGKQDELIDFSSQLHYLLSLKSLQESDTLPPFDKTNSSGFVEPLMLKWHHNFPETEMLFAVGFAAGDPFLSLRQATELYDSSSMLIEQDDEGRKRYRLSFRTSRLLDPGDSGTIDVWLDPEKSFLVDAVRSTRHDGEQRSSSTTSLTVSEHSQTERGQWYPSKIDRVVEFQSPTEKVVRRYTSVVDLVHETAADTGGLNLGFAFPEGLPVGVLDAPQSPELSRVARLRVATGSGIELSIDDVPNEMAQSQPPMSAPPISSINNSYSRKSSWPYYALGLTASLGLFALWYGCRRHRTRPHIDTPPSKTSPS